MKVTKLASALCDADFQSVVEILPPWCDSDAAMPTYKSVQELRRQRNGLVEIWPLRKAEFDRQFDERLMELAADLRAAIYDGDA